MPENKPQAVRILLTLTVGRVVSSDPIVLHDDVAHGPTLDALVSDCRQFPTRAEAIPMAVNGANVWFNPAHIVSAQIVMADVRPGEVKA